MIATLVFVAGRPQGFEDETDFRDWCAGYGGSVDLRPGPAPGGVYRCVVNTRTLVGDYKVQPAAPARMAVPTKRRACRWVLCPLSASVPTP